MTFSTNLRLAQISYKQIGIRSRSRDAAKKALGLSNKGFRKLLKEVQELALRGPKETSDLEIMKRWEEFKAEYNKAHRSETLIAINAQVMKDLENERNSTYTDEDIQRVMRFVSNEFGYSNISDLQEQED